MSIVRFSSQKIPGPERPAFFRDVYAVIEQVDIEPLGDAPLAVESAVRLLPDLAIVDATCSPCLTHRTAAHVADGKDDLVLCIVTGGAIARRRGGGEAVLYTAGEAYLGSNAFPSEHRFGLRSSFLDIAIPRALLAPRLADPDGAAARKLAPGAELRLLTRYARALIHDFAALTPTAEAHHAGHVVDLAVMALGATRDAGARAARRGLRHARLLALRADIAANLARPDLSPDWLARRHGISPRYIRDLFHGAGASFSEFVLNARLDRVHDRLTAIPPPRASISALAWEAGFGDLSYFNRAFRRRFGMTPSEALHGG